MIRRGRQISDYYYLSPYVNNGNNNNKKKCVNCAQKLKLFHLNVTVNAFF